MGNLGIIDIVSLLCAIAALGYSVISNTKRYELTYQYFQDIVNWHEQVVQTILELQTDPPDKNLLLARLSALIETGRFYFPNIDLKDGHGRQKPEAYRGYRNVVLDFLIYEYQLFQRENARDYLEHSQQLQRLFTSHVFAYLNPQKHKSKVIRNTNIMLQTELTIHEFLESAPESINALLQEESK